MLWLPYQAYSLLVRSAAQSSSPLAETSELFLLLLAFHAPVQGDAGANPYLQALRGLQVRPTAHLQPPILCNAAAVQHWGCICDSARSIGSLACNLPPICHDAVCLRHSLHQPQGERL